MSAALESPSDRIERLSGIVLRYGTAVEAHGGRANQLMADVTAAQTSLDTAHTEVVLAETELSTWARSDDYRSWSAGEETETSSSTLLSRDDRFREAVTTAQGTRDRAAEDLADAWTAWEKEFEAWDDAYARAVASLARVDSGYISTADALSLAALADADSPEEVAAIWDAMTEAERARIAASYPEFIGNLEGIPYEYRIAANVAVLEEASKTSWGEPRDGEIAKLLTTVIGHSYGSTTAFLAVGSADDNLGVDNLIAVGSAGLADRALGDDPHARVDYSGTRIYASTSPEDNWARKGRWAPDGINVTRWGTHAIDPGSIDNAVSFDSNGGFPVNSS